MRSGESDTSVWRTVRGELLRAANRLNSFGSLARDYLTLNGRDIVATMYGADSWEELERALELLTRHELRLRNIAALRILEDEEVDSVLSNPEVIAISPIDPEVSTYWQVRQAFLRESCWLPERCVPCWEQQALMSRAWNLFRSRAGETTAQAVWRVALQQSDEGFAAFRRRAAWERATFGEKWQMLDLSATDKACREASAVFENTHLSFWPAGAGTLASKWLPAAEVKARLKDAPPHIIGDLRDNDFCLAMGIQLWGDTDARFLLGLEQNSYGSPAVLLEEVVSPALPRNAIERAGGLGREATALSPDIRRKVEADTWPLLGDGSWAHYDLGNL